MLNAVLAIGLLGLLFGFGLAWAANRPALALAENCDYLDDAVSGGIPIEADVSGTTGGSAVASLAITANVWVGKLGTTDDQANRDRLINVLDSSGNQLTDSTGARVKAVLIHDGLGVNKVGQVASGFYTNPTVNFSPSIPASTSYTVVYGKKSSLYEIIADKTTQDGLIRSAISTAEELPAEAVRFFMDVARRTTGAVNAFGRSTRGRQPALAVATGKSRGLPVRSAYPARTRLR